MALRFWESSRETDQRGLLGDMESERRSPEVIFGAHLATDTRGIGCPCRAGGLLRGRVGGLPVARLRPFPDTSHHSFVAGDPLRPSAHPPRPRSAPGDELTAPRTRLPGRSGAATQSDRTGEELEPSFDCF
ncbi:hypothetical protein EYF80_041228 [Liparis tanakae]|uniref:Uncharacterized protein n=1 Tax=Liparis tanakae TaxID=230148 RepID=A0A4Z2G4S7_9TELE|nr:hypothetical protein EYF80_041228 [Liparis tanakae]